MNRNLDTAIRLTDDVRVRKIREDDARQVERKFAPIKKAAAANARRMAAGTGWLAAY